MISSCVCFPRATLHPKVNESEKIFKFVPLLLNDLRRRKQFLRIGLDELAGEGTEILSESVIQPRTVVFVPLRQSSEIVLDVAIDFFPAELELRKPPLQ